MRVSETAGDEGNGRRRYEPSGQESIVRVFVRPLGSPLPIGFFGFAMGTLLFSLYELKVICFCTGARNVAGLRDVRVIDTRESAR